MVAALVPRELATWSLSAVALGALEGALLGIIVKNQFDGVASPGLVNIAVAIVAAAPSFTNLASFVIASLAQGRDKLRLLGRLMLLMGICLLIMAIPGRTPLGLAIFCLMTVLARTAWSGILIVRAAVWRANYSRAWRGRVTARIVQMASLLVAACSALIGFMLDWNPDAFRPAFVVGAVCAILASRANRKSRLRRQRQLIAAELAEQTLQGRRLSLPVMLSVLRRDMAFRHYMMAMMVFGSGNLMLLPVLVILINEHLHLSQMQQVIVTSSLPLLVLCFSIALWARMLDQRHIFSYRAVHSWFFVAASALFASAVITRQPALLWPASIILGAAYAGGHLGWNLGHNDFSSDGNASQYMAIHVMLTGTRGLIMPLVGVGFYQFLSARWPEHAAWAMLLPLSLSLLGALIFVFLHLQLVRQFRSVADPDDPGVGKLK
jgi:MFS family permease